MTKIVETEIISTQYDFCKNGYHIKEHVNFLFDDEDDILYLDSDVIKSNFCSSCGVKL